MNELQQHLGCALVLNVDVPPGFVFKLLSAEEGNLILVLSLELPVLEELLHAEVVKASLRVKKHGPVLTLAGKREVLVLKSQAVLLRLQLLASEDVPRLELPFVGEAYEVVLDDLKGYVVRELVETHELDMVVV